MENNKWKAIAIIFIVLFFLETSFLVWASVTGMNDMTRENECILDVCGESHAYQYYPDIKTCYCYDEYGERVKEKYLG